MHAKIQRVSAYFEVHLLRLQITSVCFHGALSKSGKELIFLSPMVEFVFP